MPTVQRLTFPIASGDAPAPFALRFAVEELALGEAVWSLFDPAAVLPRDPATIVLAFSGRRVLAFRTSRS